jgi:plastocyanin
MRPAAGIGILLAGAVLAVAGCGSDDSDSAATAQAAATTTTTTMESESTDKVRIADFKYAPETVTVKAGTEIAWTNSDDATHTATADDGSFDTGDLDKGDAKSVTFDQAGSFTYYCRFHPFMKATVEVQ